mmetsp:Transcript_19600/g.63632  ORF Transcript_19600/g.63632 Transcript_19600/m.63632 type:complete len:692 (-) Transcript_19600:324-2399(-)
MSKAAHSSPLACASATRSSRSTRSSSSSSAFAASNSSAATAAASRTRASSPNRYASASICGSGVAAAASSPSAPASPSAVSGAGAGSGSGSPSSVASGAGAWSLPSAGAGAATTTAAAFASTAAASTASASFPSTLYIACAQRCVFVGGTSAFSIARASFSSSCAAAAPSAFCSSAFATSSETWATAPDQTGSGSGSADSSSPLSAGGAGGGCSSSPSAGSGGGGFATARASLQRALSAPCTSAEWYTAGERPALAAVKATASADASGGGASVSRDVGCGVETSRTLRSTAFWTLWSITFRASVASSCRLASLPVSSAVAVPLRSTTGAAHGSAGFVSICHRSRKTPGALARKTKVKVRTSPGRMEPVCSARKKRSALALAAVAPGKADDDGFVLRPHVKKTAAVPVLATWTDPWALPPAAHCIATRSWWKVREGPGVGCLAASASAAACAALASAAAAPAAASSRARRISAHASGFAAQMASSSSSSVIAFSAASRKRCAHATPRTSIASSAGAKGRSCSSCCLYLRLRAVRNLESEKVCLRSVACPAAAADVSGPRRTHSTSLFGLSSTGQKSPLKMFPTGTYRVQLSRSDIVHWSLPCRSGSGTAANKWSISSSRRRCSSARSITRSPTSFPERIARCSFTRFHSSCMRSQCSRQRVWRPPSSLTCSCQPRWMLDLDVSAVRNVPSLI